MRQHPDEVIYSGTQLGDDHGLDERNSRLYIFNLIIGALAIEYHIREDKEAFYGAVGRKGDQPPHFNSGEGERGKKLKKHHY